MRFPREKTYVLQQFSCSLHFFKKEKKRQKQRTTHIFLISSNMFSIENQMQFIPLTRNQREKTTILFYSCLDHGGLQYITCLSSIVFSICFLLFSFMLNLLFFDISNDFVLFHFFSFPIMFFICFMSFHVFSMLFIPFMCFFVLYHLLLFSLEKPLPI